MSDRYTSTKPLELVRGSRGVDYVSEPTELPAGFLTRMTNVSFHNGVMQSRRPAATYNNTFMPSAELTAVHQFDTSDGTRHLVRFNVSGVEIFRNIAAPWDAVTGITLTSAPSYRVSCIGWGDKLLFTNSRDGVFEVNPVTAVGTKLTEAVQGHQLAVFGGRVISVRRDRISWSVRNDHTDWTGVGSGYEDLRSVPDGYIGEMLCLHPISDDTALLLRGDSVWIVQQTGFVDAPFRFNRLFAAQSLVSPFAACPVQGGVIGLFRDGFAIVGPSGIQQVGESVARHILDNLRSARSISCAYDKVHRRVAFLVKELSATVVWVLHLEGMRWTRHEYGFTPRYVTTTRIKTGLVVIDSLPGKIDSLTGKIDELSLTNYIDGFAFVDADTVYIEGYTSGVDQLETASVVTPVELRTGLIYAESPDQRAKLISGRIMYRSTSNRTLSWYVSDNAGQTWTLLSTSSLPATAYNRIVHMNKPFAAEQIMVKCVIDSLFDTKILMLELQIDPGARRRT